MAKTNKHKRRMDRYFKNIQRNSYFLGCNQRGICTTKIVKKWDVIRKLTKKLISEDEKSGRISKKEARDSEPGVQLLPRQDVMLYGTIPKMEQRVFSKCKECSRVFNPRDILSHRNCSKSSPSTHHSLIKKKVKSKSGSTKKTGPSLSSSSSSNGNSTIVTIPSSLEQDNVKDFVYKKPYPPPPLTTTSSPMPQLKVSVTKIGLTKVSKSTTVSATSSASTSTTSSDKSDSSVSSSKTTSSVHHSSSSVHHSSKSSSSSGHSPRPRSPSSSGYHPSKSSSSVQHSAKSQSSSSAHHSPRSSSSSHGPSPYFHTSGRGSSHHGSSHHSSSSHRSSKSSSSSSKPIPMDTLPPTSSSHHHHSSSSHSSSSSKSSRHKKSSSSSSKKSGTSSSGSSSKALPKDYNPDTYCGVIEGSRGPCMRSITCSTHRIQLKKLVPGRSKDIHQLIAEKKAAKEKDLKHTTPPCSYTPPNGEAKDLLSTNQNIPFVPIVAKNVSTSIENSVTTTSFVPIVPRVSNHQTRQSTTSTVPKIMNVSETKKETAPELTNGYMNHTKNIEIQESVVGTVPVLIMPMSPVSVVSSVQFLKIGNNIISLESPQSAMSPPLKNSSMVLPIPTSNSNGIKMYKSHPKPIVLPSFGTRRVGGAILFANPRLESQRNELLTALNCKRETVNNNREMSLLNHSSSPHRPNILKIKAGTKTNCKRPATDKLVTSDSKRLVPDVNGFILHADVSETADAPQSNNCIQEKIALLNMK